MQTILKQLEYITMAHEAIFLNFIWLYSLVPFSSLIILTVFNQACSSAGQRTPGFLKLFLCRHRYVCVFGLPYSGLFSKVQIFMNFTNGLTTPENLLWAAA